MTTPTVSYRPAAARPDVEITTYGVLHGERPAIRYGHGVVEIDLTTALRNPHQDPAMRYRTGLDQDVYEHVMATDGAAEIVREAAEAVADWAEAAMGTAPVEVHSYCKGGRHRSVAVARALAEALTDLGLTVAVTHRDVHKPVVQAV